MQVHRKKKKKEEGNVLTRPWTAENQIHWVLCILFKEGKKKIA
jgi:hypothetical protein